MHIFRCHFENISNKCIVHWINNIKLVWHRYIEKLALKHYAQKVYSNSTLFKLSLNHSYSMKKGIIKNIIDWAKTICSIPDALTSEHIRKWGSFSIPVYSKGDSHIWVLCIVRQTMKIFAVCCNGQITKFLFFIIPSL